METKCQQVLLSNVKDVGRAAAHQKLEGRRWIECVSFDFGQFHFRRCIKTMHSLQAQISRALLCVHFHVDTYQGKKIVFLLSKSKAHLIIIPIFQARCVCERKRELDLHVCSRRYTHELLVPDLCVTSMEKGGSGECT